LVLPSQNKNLSFSVIPTQLGSIKSYLVIKDDDILFLSILVNPIPSLIISSFFIATPSTLTGPEIKEQIF